MKKTLTLLQPVLPSLGMGRAALASAMTQRAGSGRGRTGCGNSSGFPPARGGVLHWCTVVVVVVVTDDVMPCLIWSFCCKFSVCTVVVVVVTDDVMPCLVWSFCCRFFVFTTTATSSSPSSSPSTITTIIIMFVVFVLLFLFFRQVRDEIYTFGKIHMRSALSLRRLSNVSLDIVPMMGLSRSVKEDRRALSLSTPLCCPCHDVLDFV